MRDRRKDIAGSWRDNPVAPRNEDEASIVRPPHSGMRSRTKTYASTELASASTHDRTQVYRTAKIRPDTVRLTRRSVAETIDVDRDWPSIVPEARLHRRSEHMEYTSTSRPHIDNWASIYYTRMNTQSRVRIARWNTRRASPHSSNNRTNKMAPWEHRYSKLSRRARYMPRTQARMESNDTLAPRSASSYLPENRSCTSENIRIPA